MLVFKNVLTLKNEIGTFENIVFNAKNVNMNWKWKPPTEQQRKKSETYVRFYNFMNIAF